MPLYEYQCGSCGLRFERLQQYSDAPIETCPSCGGVVEKQVSSPAIQFKGSGFYITDYARKPVASESADPTSSDSTAPAAKDAAGKESSKEAAAKDSTAKDSTGKGSTAAATPASPPPTKGTSKDSKEAKDKNEAKDKKT